MATTKTEELIGLLNYGLISRQNTALENRRMNNSYTKAMENIISIYGNLAQNGAYTADEIEDFQEQVSLVSVLDNHDLYPGIDRLPLYCKELTSTIDMESTNKMVR